MTTPKPFALGKADVMTPLTGDLKTDPTFNGILKALAGGSATNDYFQMVNQFGNLYGQLSVGGDAAWSEAKDEHGMPIYYIKNVDEKGKSYYIEVKLEGLIRDADGNVNPDGSTQTVNGHTYNGIGMVTQTTGYDVGVATKVTWWMGTATAGAVVFGVLLKLMGKLIKSVATNFANCIRSMFNSVDGSSSGSENESSAEEADEVASEDTAEDAGETVAIDLSTGGLFLLAALIATVLIVLSFVLHSSAHRLRVWNLTNYTLVWSLYNDEGKLVTGPVEFDGDDIKTYNPFLPVTDSSPVPGSQPTLQAYYADYNFTSNSEGHGLGYVLQFDLVDSSSVTQYTATAMYFIPFQGDNTTSVTLDPVPSLSDYFDNNYGKDGNNTTSQAVTSSDTKITATTTYDFLTGQHPVPGMAPGAPTNTAFFYNSLLTIVQKDMQSSKSASVEYDRFAWVKARRQERKEGKRPPNRFSHHDHDSANQGAKPQTQ